MRVLDIGSHSLKLYDSTGCGVHVVCKATWDPFVAGHDRAIAILEQFIIGSAGDCRRQIDLAIGTAVLRSDHDLSRRVLGILSRLGIVATVISQEHEAELIRRAAHAHGCDPLATVVNVGGGSVQLAGPDGELLYPFGVVHLNDWFMLAGPVPTRDVDGCIDWLMQRLPRIDSFIYTGGELTYLQHLDVPVVGGLCRRDDFEAVHETMRQLGPAELGALSPYDAGWMSGAVASNCFVVSLLRHNDLQHFAPSDLNISHGMILSLIEEMHHA